jgi:hypothetical protein
LREDVQAAASHTNANPPIFKAFMKTKVPQAFV